MIDPPSVVQLEPRPAAVIHLTIPRTRAEEFMDPAIEELMRTLASQEIEPAGPLFTSHLRMSSEEFDFEIGFPVDAPLTPSGRVRPGMVPGGRVARTVYHGPYGGLYAAWKEFGDWLKAEGLRPGDGLWEVYRKGPESTPDASEWETELNRAVES